MELSHLSGVHWILGIVRTIEKALKVIVPETVCKQDAGIKIIHKLQVGVSVRLFARQIRLIVFILLSKLALAQNSRLFKFRAVLLSTTVP